MPCNSVCVVPLSPVLSRRWQAYKVQFYNNGGCTHDASLGCMDMCMMWSDNCYNVPNFNAAAKSLLTNLPSNTAMRAPGVARPAPNPRPALWQLALLTPQVNAGSLYCCGMST